MRLLIVEDEPKMLALLRDGLSAAGHHITLATDGGEALALVKDFEFDVVVLDRMLPVMDGCEVVARLRKSGNATPVLMLTARDSVGDVVSGLDAGIDDYVTKPFEFAVLNARLRALQRRPREIAPNLVRFNDLELDVDSCCLRVAGRAVNLTRTEFRILEEMIRHPDRVHRREALVERVWGYDCEVESNTLDVFICQLRAKIDKGRTGGDRTGGDKTEKSRASRSIQTVRGVGYKLSPKTP